ncbi:tyrosine-protein phosphatase [Cohnella suwonensis]|uniref:Tyrosine-protein phosphatase n=1 Tax=Cohnella suwonensis TaxID=696072 RepID=A0ABW0LZV2_9BACL
MIDIHCHILHGVDDGARDLNESVAMARLAYANGIRDIVATPHFNENYRVDADLMLRKSEELQRELDRQRIAVRIHPGNEVRFESKAFLEDHKSNRRFSYLASPAKFLLLEERWQAYDPDTTEAVERLLHEGVTPIIAHPERHFFFRERPELLLELMALGAWTQVSADSLVGNFGPEAARFGRWLCETGNASTLATDAHNMSRRPNLREGFDVFEKLAGPEALAELAARTRTILAD